MKRVPSWDDLLADRRFHWKEPDEGLEALVPRWLAEDRRVIHDLGCGAGRHMAWLQTLGFEAIGSDVSPNGLQACADYLRAAELEARLVMADMSAAPFADCCFDAVVSTNVLNHNPLALLQQAIDEVHRTLLPGGEVYLTVLNTWDWRYGSGQQVEPDSFVLAEGPEAGILHHFFSEGDLRRWLAAFELAQLKRERGLLTKSTRPDDRPVHRDAWAVCVRKR